MDKEITDEPMYIGAIAVFIILVVVLIVVFSRGGGGYDEDGWGYDEEYGDWD